MWTWLILVGLAGSMGLALTALALVVIFVLACFPFSQRLS
jgi:hypothetical protein